MIQQDIFSSQWCDIVFEHREKNYGAYMLRKRNTKDTFTAFLISAGTFIFLFSLPILLNVKSKVPEKIIKIDPPIEIINPPIISPPPPPVKPLIPKPKTNTNTNILPIIVDSIPKINPVDTFHIVNTTNNTSTSGLSNIDSIPFGNIPQNNYGSLPPDDTIPRIWVEKMPLFKGGDKALKTYIAQHVKYPPQALEGGIGGPVFISFVVDRKGKVRNVSLEKGIGWGCDQEALKVIESLPDWEPGEQNGKPVSVKFTIPVKFLIK